MENKILIIVESPAKCKKIEKILGNKYKVIASYGHFTQLNELDQINFETYDIKYKIQNRKVLKNLKDNIKNSKEVIIATDDDREGEAIGWSICKFCNLNINTTKKISFQEITEKAILGSLDNIQTLNMDRIKSQQTRQILDIYLGYKISPLLWKFIQHKLSAGRCQTPALKIIYENQREIDLQTDDTEYKVTAYFTDKHIPFSLNKGVDKKNIMEFIENHKIKDDWVIAKNTTKKVIESPPKIFITSSLQQKAYNVMKLSTKMTMKCAQELYENGFITYMRTDSSCYSVDFIKTMKDFINLNYGDTYVNNNIDSLCVNKNKNKSQEAHEGIRVCDLSLKETSLPNQTANKLYKLIYKHTLQCGMSEYKGEDFNYYIDYDKEYVYKHTERITIFDGWKILENSSLLNNDKFKLYLDVLFENDDNIILNLLDAKEKLISNLSHLSEASLVQQLEKKNIGRPSTFSNIIESLVDKGYIIKGNIKGKTINVCNYLLTSNKEIKKEEINTALNNETRKLQITPMGKQVSEFCYSHFNDIFTYEFTNNMENKLDQIENKDLSFYETLNDYISAVNKLIEETKDNYKENPEQIKKTKDISLYCGKIKNKVAYIKYGKYGYYLNYNKEKISLKSFTGFNIEDKIKKSLELTDVEKDTLIKFIEEPEKNPNLLMTLSDECSIRKSKYGIYIFYKTSQMKKPKFLKFNDEKDNNTEIRNQWITNLDKSKIINYINEKYKVSI
uniref:DNA topoisomerase n=1 Tax=Florenciella sp. virus SA2 TaxID=3240092 RepID=A0AB39JD37_9VIRU